MAANVTLANLRTRARLYADERPGGAGTFITDTELNAILNDCIRELYDLLIAARGHEYYITGSSISIVAGTSQYNLPATFYELKSLNLIWSAREWEPVHDFETLEAPQLVNSSTWGRWSPKGFRLTAGIITILPVPTSAVTADLSFIPTFTDLSMDSSTFDGVNGWELLATLDAAIAMRALQKLETTDLERRRERQYVRIEGLAADRAAAEPKRVLDVNPEANRSLWLERLPRA